ncbi:calcium-binding protein [Siccirubricoccus sp. G192]|uniref:calcium-binding protein n=1 Tax=Siccirubricoccus sp. G192 TaxID=2849651 RepID=UPI001C2C8643|nr:calcium-binding protein [Siccirubricoccus sp. G192]MBV1795752.1 hypothetical protein [Siccirubricoccus sp. G192]
MATVTGSAGDDGLVGTTGNDSLAGGAGQDALQGGAGNDTLLGGDGNDTLLGGAGADVLTGGTGADRFILQTAGAASLDSTLAAITRITDFTAAEGDLLVLRGQAAGVSLYPIATGSFAPPGGPLLPVGFAGALPARAAPLADMTLPDPTGGGAWLLYWLPAAAGDGGWLLLDADRNGVLGAGDLVVRLDLPGGGTITAASFVAGTFATLGSMVGDALSGGAGDDSILGFAGNDTLLGGEGNDTLLGGEGEDSLSGGAGFDSLLGGDGDDTLLGGAETDILDGGAGQDRLDGGTGSDLLLGGAGNDLLLGGEGEDTLEGGPGSDSLFGGTGADEFVLQAERRGAWSSLGAMGLVVDFSRAEGDRLRLGSAHPGLADGRGATAGTYTGEDGIARALVFSGSLAARGSIEAGMRLPPQPLPGLDAYQVFWVPALEGGGWLVLDLDRNGRLDAADFVARIGSDAAPVSIGAADFVAGTFFSPGGGSLVRAGTAADDTLLGGSLGETFLGSAGNDRIEGGAGAANGLSYAAFTGPVLLRIGADGSGTAEKPGGGTDSFTGIQAIAGGAGADRLDAGAATAGFFVLSLEGRAGDDTIIGNGGAAVQASYGASPGAVLVDLHLGSAQDGWGGTDTLVNLRRVTATSAWNDTILGSAFDDVFLSGASGNKVFDGRAGRDEYRYAGTGNVTIVLASTVFGNLVEGPYALKPGGTDRLSGIEIAAGGSGDDSIRGSVAAERLAGGMGNDMLDGGGGDDLVFYDYISAGAALPQQGVVLDLTAGTATDPWGGTDVLRNLLSAWGSQLGDDMTGRAVTGFRTWLRGLAGDDTLRAPLAGSLVGADYATDPAGILADLATGTVADGWGGIDRLVLIDHLRGSGFADSITGNAAANWLEGGAGDDTLDGGAGADTLTGGTGNDTYHVGSQADLVIEAADEGNDTVIATGSYYLTANVENLVLAAGAGALFGVGNALANLMLGNEDNNRLLAGIGNDTIRGNAGNDLLYGEAGNDSLDGGSGIDYLFGGAGNDTLDGGDNPDALYGEDGSDLIYGGVGFYTDILVGGAGNDTLDGSARPGAGPRNLGEYDLLNGGPGDDDYYVDTPFDLTFEAFNEGIDTVYADIVGAGYYLWPNTERLILLGITPFGVGNLLDNLLIGNSIGNWLLGGAGNDTINGMGGDDVLFGQAGADQFIFQKGSGVDTIGDFLPGQDRIQLTGFGCTAFSQVLAWTREVGPHLAISAAPGDTLVLHNVQKASLTAADFLFD